MEMGPWVGVREIFGFVEQSENAANIDSSLQVLSRQKKKPVQSWILNISRSRKPQTSGALECFQKKDRTCASTSVLWKTVWVSLRLREEPAPWLVGGYFFWIYRKGRFKEKRHCHLLVCGDILDILKL